MAQYCTLGRGGQGRANMMRAAQMTTRLQQDRAEQGRAGRGRVHQGKDECKAGQSRAEQGRMGQGRARQGRAQHNSISGNAAPEVLSPVLEVQGNAVDRLALHAVPLHLSSQNVLLDLALLQCCLFARRLPYSIHLHVFCLWTSTLEKRGKVVMG